MNAYGGPVLLDESAWARLLLGRLPAGDLKRFEQAVNAGEVLVCEPFRLEALYSARDSADFARIGERLGVLPQARGGPATLRVALDAQSALARAQAVSHRVKPMDLLIAAIAHEGSAGILHYDRDYDTIAEHSELHFRSVWIAPRGSMP